MSTRKARPTQPKVDLDITRDRLMRLGLQHAADALGEQITAAVKDTVSPHRFLDQLLEAELTNREERRIKTSLRLSGLPTGQTLGNFDFAFQPSIERSRIETLGTCAWIRERYTLLIQGPPGVGKTHLAVALGVQAIENGFSVAFFRLEELLAALKRDADLPPNRLRRRTHNNVALVVIDEVGFEPMSRQEASLFFRLVSYRYGRGSILITTNKGIRDWPEILAGDEVLATAILDRLLHRSHVLDIKGRSYRLRDLERWLDGSQSDRDAGGGSKIGGDAVVIDRGLDQQVESIAEDGHVLDIGQVARAVHRRGAAKRHPPLRRKATPTSTRLSFLRGSPVLRGSAAVHGLIGWT